MKDVVDKTKCQNGKTGTVGTVQSGILPTYEHLPVLSLTSHHATRSLDSTSWVMGSAKHILQYSEDFFDIDQKKHKQYINTY